MTTAIQEILAVAGQQLEDIFHITWSNTTVLIPYLNYAILEIINLKPDAYPVTKDLTLYPGPIQSIGTTDINIIDFVCNMGLAGTTPGQTVIDLNKEQMDAILPGWMSFPTADVVSYAIIDSRNPKTFYVFPPQPNPATQRLRVVLSKAPDLITADTDIFPLDDSYKPAMVDYLVYRALSEETTIPATMEKAQVFYQKFMSDLGLKTNVEKAIEVKGR
jgi:hypothetical protein